VQSGRQSVHALMQQLAGKIEEFRKKNNHG
jgi:hypothetical protein